MYRYKANITIEDFQKIKHRYPEHAEKLEQIVQYAGPKALFYMDRVHGIPDALKDELWLLTLKIDKSSFSSYFIQLREILELPKSEVENIIEIGPGDGIFKSLISKFPYQLTTIDVTSENNPDIICDILNNPIKDKTFDMVVCFQVLEHIPYKYFRSVISTLASISKNYLFISIPYQTNSLAFSLRTRFVSRVLNRMNGKLEFLLNVRLPIRDIDESVLMQRKDKHNPHYWEAGRRSYPIKRICEDIETCKLKILKKFPNPDFPYHYFILSSVYQ
jgi:2-polyprenyl-3-methyl-5-hydroxy-6-metoxy-1,4-benzoquinol methylase